MHSPIRDLRWPAFKMNCIHDCMKTVGVWPGIEMAIARGAGTGTGVEIARDGLSFERVF